MNDKIEVYEDSEQEFAVAWGDDGYCFLSAIPGYGETEWFVNDVHVPPAKQRQGRAWAMYDAAEVILNARGLKLVPSRNLTPATFCLWMRRNPFELERVLSYFDKAHEGYDEEIVNRARQQLTICRRCHTGGLRLRSTHAPL